MNTELRNELVNLYVTAGLYRLARGAEPAPAEAERAPRSMLALIQINLAEADYNLGHWAQAEQRLAFLDTDCARLPVTRAGLLQQRAWIAAHTGRAEPRSSSTRASPPPRAITPLPSASAAAAPSTRSTARAATGCCSGETA